jgi:hypothetical protein
LQFQENHGRYDKGKYGVADEKYDCDERVTSGEQGRETKHEKHCPG